MTVQGINVGEELRRLVAEGQITLDSLTAITGIAPDVLTAAMDAAPGLLSVPTGLTGDETRRLSMLVGQLTAGAGIDDDVRLRAIVETLHTQFGLSSENLARLTRTHPGDLDAYLSDPSAVSPELRFALAVRLYYVFRAVLDATPGGPTRG